MSSTRSFVPASASLAFMALTEMFCGCSQRRRTLQDIDITAYNVIKELVDRCALENIDALHD
jgi:hypothetical protein